MKNELNIQDNTPIQIKISEKPEQIDISEICFESIDKMKLMQGAQGKCLKYSLEVANKNLDVEIIHGIIITVNENNSAHGMAHAWNRIGKLHFDVTKSEIWIDFEIEKSKIKEVRYAPIESYLSIEQPSNFSAQVIEIVEKINTELAIRLTSKQDEKI